jgi:hypothetical protein
VLVSWNVLELEVEEEDGSNPAIDCGIWLDIGVAEHTFDIAGINLHDKLADADEVEAGSVEGVEESIELQLSLGVAGLALIPQDEAKV